MISLLVAASENNAIGKDNQLLWHLPNDLKYFKNLTWAMPVIMGRKTFESMNKPLPGRINIVVTQSSRRIDGVQLCSSIEEALHVANSTNCKETFVIGGGEIFNQTLSRAERIYLTRVHADLKGDTFFPEIDQELWKQTGNKDFLKDEKHAYDYSFQTWERKD
jgi:dihydrofolate reductase